MHPADRNLAISPDGRHVVYRSGNPSQLVLRPLDRREGQVIAGTGGARYPFFSPDGRWIAFFDGLMLKRVAVAGGPVLTICESEIPRGASWGDDGHIVFATRRQMLRVAADGGEPVELTKPDPVSGELGVGISRSCPEVAACCSPSFRAGSRCHATRRGPRSHERQIKRLVPGSHPEYVETGHLLFVATGRLWAVRFDTTNLDVVGDPTPVVEGIRTGDTGATNYAVSHTGTLVYIPQPATAGVKRSRGSTVTGARLPSMRRLDPISLPACHPMAPARRWPFSIRGSGMLASLISAQRRC